MYLSIQCHHNEAGAALQAQHPAAEAEGVEVCVAVQRVQLHTVV